MTEAFLAGVGMSAFGRHPAQGVKALTRFAVEEALSDAGLNTSAIEVAFFGNLIQGVVEGQSSCPGQVALRPLGIEGIPIINVENACATGSTAFWLAYQQVTSGAVDVALAVGAEKLFYDDPVLAAKVFAEFDGAIDVHDREGVWAAVCGMGGGELKAEDVGRRTFTMDIYSQLCRWHMDKFGSTQRQQAVISSKNHIHSQFNDKAMFQRPMTVDEVLAGRALAYPLTVPMCSPISSGASAAILVSPAAVKKYGLGRANVRIDTCHMTSALGSRALEDLDNHVLMRASRTAYEKAGIGPGDIHVVECHDATAFGELWSTELLGLCDLGGGGELAESGATSLGGRIPVNPSGGLECRGHPIGATGLAQIYELATQLRGEAGGRQVGGAKTAMAQNGGAWVKYEEANEVITILTKA